MTRRKDHRDLYATYHFKCKQCGVRYPDANRAKCFKCGGIDTIVYDRIKRQPEKKKSKARGGTVRINV